MSSALSKPSKKHEQPPPPPEKNLVPVVYPLNVSRRRMHPRRSTEAVSKMESENNNTPSHKKGKKTRRVKANNFPFLSPTTREESFGRKGVRLSLFFIPLSLYYYYTTLLLLLLIPTENRRGRMGEKEPEEGNGEREKKFLLGKAEGRGFFFHLRARGCHPLPSLLPSQETK